MDIKNLWETIKLIFGEMWVVIWPSVKIVLTQSGKYTLATAINVVKQVQESMPNATGAEKAAAAFAQISAILLSQGIQVSVSIIKLAIEYAYQHMKAEPEVIAEAKAMMLVAEEEGPIPDWVK
jgi:TATA-box binding protein (TBP) (component of TFIID and TFIIIB)